MQVLQVPCTVPCVSPVGALKYFLRGADVLPGAHNQQRQRPLAKHSKARASAIAERPLDMDKPASCVDRDVARVLHSAAEISARITEMGGRLALDYNQKAPLVVGVLKGSFIFTADLVRAMQPSPRGLTMQFVRASSYGSATESSGVVHLTCDAGLDQAHGRHVLLVEDIVDTGRTITLLKKHLTENCGAASVRVVTLLNKKARRKVEFEPDYCCFQCPDEFVIGYGLDFNEEYRALPYVGVLKPECYLPPGEA